MLICPAVHIPTRSLLRSSSTPEPSDPLYSIVFFKQQLASRQKPALQQDSKCKQFTSPHEGGEQKGEPWRRRSSLNGWPSPQRGQRGTVPPSGPPPETLREASRPRPRSSSVTAAADKPSALGSDSQHLWKEKKMRERHPRWFNLALVCEHKSIMILPQVHLRKPCYDFYFL